MTTERLVAWLPTIALALFAFSPASAYFVKPDGTGDYPTIQAAIDAAADFTVIDLDDGIFTGAGNRNIRFGGKQLVVRSRSGNAAACVVDAGASESDPARVFLFLDHEGPGTRLENVTVTGGYLPPGPGWQNTIGAGIYIKQSSPSIVGCIVTGNYCTGGGALMLYLDASLVTDCVITNNHIGLSGHLGYSTITGCTIADNTTAGVGNLHSEIALYDCRIMDNGTWGVAATEMATTYLEDTEISGNRGGGLASGDHSALTLVRCGVFDNRGPTAGGIYSFELSSVTLTECVLAANEAVAAPGGGLRLETGSATITGTTVLANAAERGGGLFIQAASVRVERTLFDGNCASGDGAIAYIEFPTDAVTFACCALDPDAVWADAPSSVAYEGNPVTTDALLCSDLACDGGVPETVDVTVREGSPCLPEGNPCGVLIGAAGMGCPASPIERTSWSGLKGIYRIDRRSR